MKIPISWLSEYVDLTGVTDVRLSDVLTMSGTENEIVKGTTDFPNIVVGEIKKIEKHPNADKLQITKTDVGKNNGGVLQIVCGAPNISVGQKVPVALLGADMGEFEIKEAEIRGVKSYGMLCSESELGISDDHTGIMILDARAKIGVGLADALNIGGVVLVAEITPNRGDCLSVIGVAREAAATLGRKIKGINFKTESVKTSRKMNVSVLEKEICPRYIAKVVEGVKIGPSPKWMQDRLSAAGVRPISNMVDVTNYVMLEWGQPLHAFDGDKISGKIIVRKAKAGEKLITLDGVERTLKTSDLVIADTKRAIALAGVMGGQNTEVTEKTKTVVLEAAVFDPVSVRKTAQRLSLRSEASSRFEKGIPLALPEISIERAAELLVKTGGGKAGEKVDVLSQWIWTQHVGMRLSRINTLMGIEIPAERSLEILHSLGFEACKFDFKKESRSHVGKPYVWGASYRTHGNMAFDCSYLTDYIYSQIGIFIGHTALAQFELGKTVKDADLQPGDVLFLKGHIDKSVTDHYFIPNGAGGVKKVNLSAPKEIGHCAIYIGDGRLIHARHYGSDKKTGEWKKLTTGKVVEEGVESFTKHPEYLGAKRYIDAPYDYLSITVPWWRLDVSIEEDIFEEIGRIYGYDKLPSYLPSGVLPAFEDNQEHKMIGEIKNILLGVGCFEVYNYSFISKKQVESIGVDTKNVVKIANPINPEQEYMRPSLVSSLLADAVTNQDNFEEFNIFEIASVYSPAKKEQTHEAQKLGLVSKSKGKGSRAYYALKGVIENMARKLHLGKLEFRSDSINYLSQGQSATIYIEGTKIGYLGMVNDRVGNLYGLKTPIAVAEVEIPVLVKYFGKVSKYRSISRFPESKRDINLIFKSNTRAQDIENTLSKIEINNLRKVEIVDIYEGGNLPEGEKSVTIRMVFGASDRTLEEAETKTYMDQIVSILKKKFETKERI
jgi:phenylalanyl-tRNA synthetase beta subunit